MNTNELADELKRLQGIHPLSIPFVLDEAATMLRQQQARIKQLEEPETPCEELRRLQNEENNEPVAWMSKEDFEDYLSEDKRVTSATVFNFKLDIPLYTHPVIKLNEVNRAIGFDNGYKAGYNKGHEDGRKLVTVKELTDGEIKELAHQHRWNGDVDFARAILRKAQEADKIESLGTVNIGGVHFRNGKEVK